MPYLTPYLTCTSCGAFNVIDAHRVQGYTLHTVADQSVVPKCNGCHSTLHVIPGAHSISSIAIKQRISEETIQLLRNSSAIEIQRIFRGFAAWNYTQLRRIQEKEQARRRKDASTCIQRIARGKRARRTFFITRCLSIIQNAHVLLLTRAIQNTGVGKPVFWYNDDEECDVLYSDYRLLVERTGNKPPLLVVEENIIEIAKRVLVIEKVMVARIQALWRGLTSRIAFHILREERGWDASNRIRPVMILSRKFRNFLGRRFVSKVRFTAHHDQILLSYKNERKTKQVLKNASEERARVLRAYRILKKEKTSARLLRRRLSCQNNVVSPLVQKKKVVMKKYIVPSTASSSTMSNNQKESSSKSDAIRRFCQRKSLPLPVLRKNSFVDGLRSQMHSVKQDDDETDRE